ncbi:MAG TPA: ABC transporter permease [Armatimonadota bacterium]|jgi:ribose/xylose/arabinose/galactoside ABC-type transport system permease subunit
MSPATPQAAAASPPRPPRALRALLDYGILLFLAALVLYFDLATQGRFHRADNLHNIGLQVAINGILAVGMTLVIISGGIDLSVGSVVAFVGIFATNTLMNGLAFGGHVWMHALPVGPGIALAFGLALALGAFIGLVGGTVITRLNVPPFIMTLALYTAIRGMAYVYTNAVPVGDLPDRFTWWGGAPMVIIAVIAFAVGEFTLRRTRFGRYVYAVGGNEEASRLSGVRVAAVKTWVYVMMGTLGGLCGVLQAARIGSGDPEAGAGFELNAIAAVVLGGASLMGGRGTALGTLVGVLVIGVLNNGLQQVGVSPYWQLVIKGLVILLAVVLDQIKARWMKV